MTNWDDAISYLIDAARDDILARTNQSNELLKTNRTALRSAIAELEREQEKIRTLPEVRRVEQSYLTAGVKALAEGWKSR